MHIHLTGTTSCFSPILDSSLARKGKRVAPGVSQEEKQWRATQNNLLKSIFSRKQQPSLLHHQRIIHQFDLFPFLSLVRKRTKSLEIALLFTYVLGATHNNRKQQATWCFPELFNTVLQPIHILFTAESAVWYFTLIFIRLVDFRVSKTKRKSKNQSIPEFFTLITKINKWQFFRGEPNLLVGGPNWGWVGSFFWR